jgi:2-(1,2-epoxy-1,2-dihydrophenyl)acetyl-CoA isomerase
MSGILVSIDLGICTITLNRPEKYNSFVREMALALQATIDACKDDPEVRVVIITGAGKAFCAGQDLNEAIDPEGPELQKIVAEHFNPIIEGIRELEKPVVAAVNGVAAGAGANIALACDLVLAKESASFIQAFSKIGLIPDSGGTYFLPRIIGLQKATALMMLGEPLKAQEAERLDMIYKAVKDDQFEKEVRDLAAKLAMMPTKALGLTKRALNVTFENELSKQLAIEEQLQFAASRTADYKEGVQAFLEKRKPDFHGA